MMANGTDDILRAAPKGKRDVLLAKIRIITGDRARLARQEAGRIFAEAGGPLESGGVLQMAWQDALERARHSATALTQACLKSVSRT